MSPAPWHAALICTGLIALLGGAGTAAAEDRRRAGPPVCERGKGIERELGQRGFRIVVSGGYRLRDDRRVKLQLWENEDSDWVITEAFLGRNRTCVVRSGRGLHMLY